MCIGYVFQKKRRMIVMKKRIGKSKFEVRSIKSERVWNVLERNSGIEIVVLCTVGSRLTL